VGGKVLGVVLNRMGSSADGYYYYYSYYSRRSDAAVRWKDGERELSECRRPKRIRQWYVPLEADGRYLGRYRLILQYRTIGLGFAGRYLAGDRNDDQS